MVISQKNKTTDKTVSSLFKAQHLTFSYSKNDYISDLSLELSAGDRLGLLGPNGSGKTTLIRLLTGLLLPHAGSILLNNEDITTLPLYKRARLGMGYLPQEPSIFRDLTAQQNLELVLQEKRPKKPVKPNAVDNMIAFLDLASVQHAKGNQLSGGERRRVEIGRALLLEPAILFLDEPFAGLDPLSIQSITALLKTISKNGISLFITDHNVSETLNLCTQALILDQGAILCSGSPEDVANHEKVKERYLGADFTLESS